MPFLKEKWNDEFPIRDLNPGTIIEITEIKNNPNFYYQYIIGDLFITVPQNVCWNSDSNPGFMLQLKSGELFCCEETIRVNFKYKIIKKPN